MVLIRSPGLRVDTLAERQQAMTHAGMPHWAGTGPENTVCGQCRHFSEPQNAGKCSKRLVRGARSQPPYPSSTPSCKYFSAREAR